MEYLLYHLAVFRNSKRGLGNKPPEDIEEQKSNEIDNYEIRRQVGEPHIQLLNKDWIKERRAALKNTQTVVKSMWDEIFGS